MDHLFFKFALRHKILKSFLYIPSTLIVIHFLSVIKNMAKSFTMDWYRCSNFISARSIMVHTNYNSSTSSNTNTHIFDRQDTIVEKWRK